MSNEPNKISINKTDNMVIVDGLGFNNLDLSSIESNIHAIQFDNTTSQGHVEYNDGKTNKKITDISDYQLIIDSYAEKKTDYETQKQKDKEDFETYKESYQYKRSVSYPPIQEQLDMQYHDAINGTNTWIDAITKVKEYYKK